MYRRLATFCVAACLIWMEPATKPQLEARLARYRELAHQYFDPVSVENMRLATAELEQKIRDCEE